MKPQAKIVIPVVVVLAAGSLVWWFTRPSEFLYAGTIEATEVLVSARVASVVAARLVAEGDHVTSGQVVLTLAGEDLRLAAKLAQRDFDRGQELFSNGSITEATLDQLRFKRDQTALAVQWCTIQAPRAGTVLRTYRENGETVGPGTSLLTLADLGEVWAYCYVPQPMLARLRVGQEVTGRLPEIPGRGFQGRLAIIRNEAEFTPRNVQTQDERTRLVYGIKVVFPNPDGILKPGMTIEVRLPEK